MRSTPIAMYKLTLIPALLITVTTLGQTGGYQGSVGATIGAGIPLGGYADTMGRGMFTFGGVLTLPAKRLPLQLGFAFDYGIMGRKTSKIVVMDAVQVPTEGRIALTEKVLSYHPLLRFSPLKGPVRPYVEGMVGLRHFSTKSNITVDGTGGAVQRSRHSDDMVLSSGWAAGLMVDLGGTAYMEARVERMYSGKAEYVDPGSIAIDGQGNVAFSTLQSTTGTLNLLLGVGLRF